MALSPWRHLRRWLLFPVLVALVAASGCGKGIGEVTGKVIFNGTHLKGGTVTFIGADKQARASGISEDGTFTIAEIPAGPVKISVETESLVRQMYVPKYSAPPEMRGYKTSDPEEAKRRYTKIPDQYADPEASGLTYTVKAGKQEHKIELK